MLNVSFIKKEDGGYSSFNLFNYNKFWIRPVSNMGFKGTELFNPFRLLAINLGF